MEDFDNPIQAEPQHLRFLKDQSLGHLAGSRTLSSCNAAKEKGHVEQVC